MGSHQPVTERTECRGMVVGVDGSPGSEHALRWAIANADHFGPIQPVATWRYPWWMTPVQLPGGPTPPPRLQFQEQAEARLEHSLDATGRAHCKVPIVCESPAGPALVTLGGEADLIVVGSRGRGATADALLGSVGAHVAAKATVPVVIVPQDAPIDRTLGRVVVGLDGSPSSIAALSWAIRRSPCEATIEAVYTWSHTPTSLTEAGLPSTDVGELEARQVLDETVVRAILAAGGTRRKIVHRVEYGDPRQVLRELSEDADLLVLGATGHRRIASLPLGSTTIGLTHQPPTTIVVVPSADDR